MYTAILAIVLLTSTPKPVDNLNQVQPIPFPDRTIAAQTAIAADQARIAAAEAERAALEAQQYQTPEPIETPVIQPYTGSNGYTPGQCVWGVKNWRPELPSNWGSAYQWLGNARSQGWPTGSEPRVGAVGVAGNHVVLIVGVNPDNTVDIKDMNGNWIPFQIGYGRFPSNHYQYIY